MKGTLGLCLLLCMACTHLYSVNGANIDAVKRPKDKVVKEGDETGPELMQCKIDASASPAFSNFEWQVGGALICDAATQAAPCKFEGTYADAYVIDSEKYNLKAINKVAIPFSLAGEYECAVTVTPPEADVPKATLTVVGDPACPDPIISIPKGTTQRISCEMSYKGTAGPVLTMTGPGSVDETGTEGDPDDTSGIVKITATYEVPTTEAVGKKVYTCTAVTAGITHVTCQITVTVIENVIKTPPKSLNFAKMEDTTFFMPCSVNENPYKKVKWYKEKIDPANLLCTGTPAAATYADPCTTDYTIDTPAKHDLGIKKIADASAGQYFCNVEIVDGTPGTEQYDPVLALVKSDPACGGTWDGTSLKLNCSVEIKGTDIEPTITWTIKENTEIIEGTTTKPASGTDWKRVDHIATAKDASSKIYVCHVKKDGVTDMATCEQSGASALSAKFLQSTLLSLVVLFVMSRFK